MPSPNARDLVENYRAEGLAPLVEFETTPALLAAAVKRPPVSMPLATFLDLLDHPLPEALAEEVGALTIPPRFIRAFLAHLPKSEPLRMWVYAPSPEGPAYTRLGPRVALLGTMSEGVDFVCYGVRAEASA